MQRQTLVLLGISLSLSLLVIIPAYAIDIQPALCSITNGSATITCKGFKDTFTFKGGTGINIQIDTTTKTVTIISKATNGTLPNELYCPANEFFNAFNATTKDFRCQVIAGGGSGLSTMHNIGTPATASIYAGNTTSFDFNFKRLLAGANIQIINGSQLITVSASGWQNNTGTNLGTHGYGLYAGMSGDVLQFLKILNGTGISVTTNGTSLIISAQGTTDTNTAQGLNIGSGTAQIYAGNQNSTQLKERSILGTGGATASNDSSTIYVHSNIYQNNTGSNLGTSGTGIYSGMSGTILQFLKVVCSTGLLCSSNSTNVILTNTVTDTNTAQISSAGGGTSLFSSRDNATQNSLKSLTNVTGYLLWNHDTTTITPSFQFKANSKTCPGGQFINVFSNSTDQSCASPTGFISSINTDSNSAQTLSGTARNVTITNNGGGSHTFNLGDAVVMINGAIQTVTKTIILNALKLGGQMDLNGNSFINSGHVYTWPLNSGNVLLGNGSGSSLSGVVYSVNALNGALTISCVSGNTTCTTSGGNTITVNTAWKVVVTDGALQRFTKSLIIPDPELNGIQLSYVSKTTSYTPTNNDVVISVDATNANPTIITLPDAIANVNNTFFIKKIDTSKNLVMIKTTSSQTIDTFSNMNLTNANDIAIFISDGANWKRLYYPSYDYAGFYLKGASQNRWFGSWVNQGTPTTITPTANTLNAVPFIVPHTIKITKIQLEISTLGSGANCRMGIYTDNGTAYPQHLVSGSDVGQVAGSSTGVKTNTFASPITLQEGLYWLSEDCSATAPSLRAVPTSSIASTLGEISTMGTAVGGTGYQVSFTFGALPTTFPASATITVTAQPEILILITG
jgi:hypothetical protein